MGVGGEWDGGLVLWAKGERKTKSKKKTKAKLRVCEKRRESPDLKNYAVELVSGVTVRERRRTAERCGWVEDKLQREKPGHASTGSYKALKRKKSKMTSLARDPGVKGISGNFHWEKKLGVRGVKGSREERRTVTITRGSRLGDGGWSGSRREGIGTGNITYAMAQGIERG